MEETSIKNRDHTTWVKLSLIRDTIVKIRKYELVPYNVTPRQAVVLNTIYDCGDKATFKNISKRVFREVHSVSEQMTRMEKKGLVKRIKNSNETALTRFELSDKGREAIKFARLEESLHNIMSVLSEKEHLQLTSFLDRLLTKAQELHF